MPWRDPSTPTHLAFSAWRREQVGSTGQAQVGDVMRELGVGTPGEVRRMFDQARANATGETQPGAPGGSGPFYPEPGGGDGGGGGGGDGGGDAPDTPSQEDVSALFPWMPGNLTQLFTDLWAEHGEAELALAHLRQTPEHREAFPGIRREDGSLRYTEQGYMQAKQGFESTLREFGLLPPASPGAVTSPTTREGTRERMGGRVGDVTAGDPSSLAQVREMMRGRLGDPNLQAGESRTLSALPSSFARAGGIGQFDLTGLFENEVTPEQFAQGIANMVQQFTAPGAEPPMGLLEMFVQGFTSTGSATLALQQVRDSQEYAQMFPGIRREDGSLIMQESEYFAHREGMRRLFGQWGLNPAMFEGHHPELIQGEVSIDELDARLRAKIEGVQQNLDQVRERFGQFYGIDAMDDRALIAAAIDPQIGMDLLQGRITAAQVSGEAAVHGFDRGRERSEALAQIGGLDQARARELFSQGARAVPRTQRFAERFHDRTGFGIEEFEEAAVFGSADEQRRLQRLHASEQALFRRGGQVRRDRDGLGLAGLRRR